MIRKQFALLLSTAFVLAACDKGASGVKGSKGKMLPKQVLDECPAADGYWKLGANNSLIHFTRTEGYLTINHFDLNGKIVADGKARDVENNETKAKMSATATCAKQVIKVTFMSEGKTVSQTWSVGPVTDESGHTEDVLKVSESGAEGEKTHTGKRVDQYSTPEESWKGNQAF